MTRDDIRQALINEDALQGSWATVYARTLGYCGHDLLVHRPGFGGPDRDYLLAMDFEHMAQFGTYRYL